MTDVVPALCTRRRRQALLDVGVALLIVVMVWPFPVMRALLSPIGHVVAMLASWALTTVVYFGVSAALWQRTLGMRAFGLRLDGGDDAEPTRGSATWWGIIAGATVLWLAIAPTSACNSGVAERASGTRIVSADGRPND